ncbi:hypothetical protein ACFL2V_13175 [Pseudomonadota bacterium]
MRAKLLGVGLVALTMLLGGCAGIQALHTNQSLLDEYGVMTTWSEGEAKAQLVKLEQTYKQFPSHENRVRLAAVLGFGKGEAAEPKRALELFKETQQASPKSTTGTLAGLFIELLETRERLSGTRWVLKKERKKVAELEQKLQELTSIEKSLLHRD